MATLPSSPLYRVDHIKKDTYHLVAKKICDSGNKLFNRINDISGYDNENEDNEACPTKFSVAVLGQIGFILECEDLTHNVSSREKFILNKFNDKIKIDDQSAIDSSIEIEADFISKRILTYTGEGIHFVLDCTCSIGGNLIPLTADFYTIGIDISPTRCELCRHNLKVYGLEDRSVVVNSDSNHFLSSIDFDNPDSFLQFGIDVTTHPFDKLLKYGFSCICLSPPWGGANYPGSSDKSVTYGINDIQSLDLVDLLVKARKFTNFISLLLPKSQSIPDLIHLSNILNLPFITADLLYNRHNSPLPRVCYVHYTTHHMSIPPNAKFKKTNMEWETPENSEYVDIFVPIKYNHDKINLIAPHAITHGIDLNTSPFTRALAESIISILDEPIYVLPRLIEIINNIEMDNVQLLLQRAFEIYHFKDMKYTLNGKIKNRTFGGIFFYLFKMEYREVYKQIEKAHRAKKRQNSKSS